LIISFKDSSLHDACVKLHQAEQLYGSVHAAALVTFISDAEAFESVGELLDFLGDDIQLLPDESLSVLIGSDYRVALVVAGKRFDRDVGGRVVWTSVKRLKLVEISRVP
jgi:hypothetical protein